MDRRKVIFGLAAFPWARGLAWADAPPWRMALIGGGFIDGHWLAGVKIDLDEGWDTYCRIPGDAGIPPDFGWKRSQGVASVEVFYPLPQRFETAAGETVGYREQVVFPVRVTPAGDAAGAKLMLDLFFAVCKDVCIPARAKASLALSNASVLSADDEEVAKWLKRVPVAGAPVVSVTAQVEGGKAMLVVKLSEPASDIFVESESAWFFRKPAFSSGGLEARMVVEGLDDPQKLHGLPLKLTVAMEARALEQQVTVA